MIVGAIIVVLLVAYAAVKLEGSHFLTTLSAGLWTVAIGVPLALCFVWPVAVYYGWPTATIMFAAVMAAGLVAARARNRSTPGRPPWGADAVSPAPPDSPK